MRNDRGCLLLRLQVLGRCTAGAGPCTFAHFQLTLQCVYPLLPPLALFLAPPSLAPFLAPSSRALLRACHVRVLLLATPPTCPRPSTPFVNTPSTNSECFPSRYLCTMRNWHALFTAPPSCSRAHRDHRAPKEQPQCQGLWPIGPGRACVCPRPWRSML